MSAGDPAVCLQRGRHMPHDTTTEAGGKSRRRFLSRMQAVNLLGNIEGCWPTGVADSASEGVHTACASHAPSTAGTTHPTLLLQPLAC